VTCDVRYISYRHLEPPFTSAVSYINSSWLIKYAPNILLVPDFAGLQGILGSDWTKFQQNQLTTWDAVVFPYTAPWEIKPFLTGRNNVSTEYQF